MTAVLWRADQPNRCACDDTYQPVLTGGKLVKKVEPAWSMLEQTRDPRCLQERCRHLARFYPRVRYQHHKTSKGSGSGYPDCHFWAPGRGSMYAELKRMGKNPTIEQADVMASLQDADPRNRVYLFRPCCMLVGAVDEALAEFTGSRCLYAGGSRGRPSLDQVLADMDATAVRPRATARPKREPVLPGADPQPFSPACGLIVPPPTDSIGSAAMAFLELWLRGAGFSPVDVPYPMRLILGNGMVHVHCRVGLARPGHDVRVWRGGAPAGPFPEHLLGALRADQVMGPSSEKVAWLIETMPNSGTVLMPPDGGEENIRC